MIGRMLGAARLNAATYEDVEKDGGATKQALLVVIIVTIASFIGKCAKQRRRYQHNQRPDRRLSARHSRLGHMGAGNLDSRGNNTEDREDRSGLGTGWREAWDSHRPRKS